MALAHSRHFVDGVLEGRIPNGFDNRLTSVAHALPWTSGAMLAAAREALSNGKVAVAPVSGFHHACHEEASGYCTFNGLIAVDVGLDQDIDALATALQQSLAGGVFGQRALLKSMRDAPLRTALV